MRIDETAFFIIINGSSVSNEMNAFKLTDRQSIIKSNKLYCINVWVNKQIPMNTNTNTNKLVSFVWIMYYVKYE